MFRNRYKLIVSIIIIILLLLGNVYAVPYIRLIINGQQVYTDVPPQIVNGTTLVPIRVISETLGAKVNWDGDTQTVTVDMPQYTLEARTVEYFWDVYSNNIENVQEPKLDNSVSPELKTLLSKAYELLKQKAPQVYEFVCAYILEIQEAPLDKSIAAVTDTATHIVTFNSSYTKQAINFPGTLGVEVIATTLAHEAYHESSVCTGTYNTAVDNKTIEALAYAFEYGVAKQLGVSQDYFNWIKTQIINNLN
ncbi:copper amine oxidase-like protein [Thermohydrogenium kirishiense]|uniref:copper amine oxidase N-terminal domain-containing protein n=1 Tax=Thermoanaerobacterium thermosaccharolyticum TaxID=1517 RepID=UPI0010EF3D9F|nr:copper amine oxidase-like protein [Thermohydrogenium kirishiense]